MLLTSASIRLRNDVWIDANFGYLYSRTTVQQDAFVYHTSIRKIAGSIAIRMLSTRGGKQQRIDRILVDDKKNRYLKAASFWRCHRSQDGLARVFGDDAAESGAASSVQASAQRATATTEGPVERVAMD